MDVFGGQVIRAPEPVHGKPAEIYHQGKGVFIDTNILLDFLLQREPFFHDAEQLFQAIDKNNKQLKQLKLD